MQNMHILTENLTLGVWKESSLSIHTVHRMSWEAYILSTRGIDWLLHDLILFANYDKELLFCWSLYAGTSRGSPGVLQPRVVEF